MKVRSVLLYVAAAMLALLVPACAPLPKQPADDVVAGKSAVATSRTLIGGAISDLDNAKEALK